MPGAPPAPPTATAGFVAGSVVVALGLLVLRLAGAAALPAYAVALPVGLLTAIVWGRRRAGVAAAPGLTAVLVVSFSLLSGVLVEFLLAVLGAR